MQYLTPVVLYGVSPVTAEPNEIKAKAIQHSEKLVAMIEKYKQ